MWTSSDELAHYGVKGMEWGRRKKEEDETEVYRNPETAVAARNYTHKYQDYRRAKAKYFAGKVGRAEMERLRAEATARANHYRRLRLEEAENQQKLLEIQNDAAVRRQKERLEQMLYPDFTSGPKKPLDFTSKPSAGNVKLEERTNEDGTKSWVNAEFYKKYSSKNKTHASSGKTSSGSTASGKTRTHASSGSTASGTPRPAGVHASSGSTASGKSGTHASSGKTTSKKRRKTVPIPIEKKTM